MTAITTALESARPRVTGGTRPQVDFDDFYALVALNARYAAVLDAGDWDAWPEFFVEDCVYQVLPRENHERGRPLAVLAFESKGMLKDRVYGIKETLFFDPYYQRHLIGTPLIHACDGELIEAETNYAVLRTKCEQMSDVYNTGRYLDRIRKTPAGLRFESRICVFDSEMIPNSLIYPI
ncbi:MULTISPECIES: aromatic-ring-hydroxylating dioxygenase subunit beta [Paraburkholderia]|uniref:Salicylate 5-hydroxylase small subunit n=1 Tax=Paraburkholderia megapolitana TaxID=420953 RepID=A0A1I3IR36_9BURK|nr:MULTISPECIES: aromatic-ring-hydroxylating dioxygenase subunit beta [Paraburkholderia]MCX4161033.1 aromatic-ring-hydroxylating dioxygenase subunit beta [Paraburkholderia megapolitana]MDN7156529.1 aromatic-ring-hydroxylating dioxygenase subunit beta [Paraburkholderia sp. CHISQ3]MDQ6493574.1 aromatic-ring-hydroxylating dioxygenase subunit beta [Paraburkholderia megapolitana]QDQ85083.1 aromatic-ring-hydroxylating dioxygenase subunit beta [Paraburkholderia megapolitana]SFI50436.1 salicylate 5-hy